MITSQGVGKMVSSQGGASLGPLDRDGEVWCGPSQGGEYVVAPSHGGLRVCLYGG